MLNVMKTNYLLPHKFKKIGWILFIPAIILALFQVICEWEPAFLDVQVFALFGDDWNFLGNNSDEVSKPYFNIIRNNILNEILGIACIVSGIMVAFSRQKVEDEFISQIRLESLVWATYLNYGILALAFILVYDLAFFWIMVFNMFTILIFFIIRFNWRLHRVKMSTV